MLDKIQNTSSEQILQSQTLDRINSLGVSNPFKNDYKNFFVDEGLISDAAMQKYQRELDVKSFSSLLMETDQKAADELVISQLFEGKFSIDDTDFLSQLLDNQDFLNDVKE